MIYYDELGLISNLKKQILNMSMDMYLSEYLKFFKIRERSNIYKKMSNFTINN